MWLPVLFQTFPIVFRWSFRTIFHSVSRRFFSPRLIVRHAFHSINTDRESSPSHLPSIPGRLQSETLKLLDLPYTLLRSFLHSLRKAFLSSDPPLTGRLSSYHQWLPFFFGIRESRSLRPPNFLFRAPPFASAGVAPDGHLLRKAPCKLLSFVLFSPVSVSFSASARREDAGIGSSPQTLPPFTGVFLCGSPPPQPPLCGARHLCALTTRYILV